jgi:quercetin dioxygenase-like cupin family protein
LAYRITHLDELEFEDRQYRPGDPPRRAASLTEALGLEASRATVWRYPPAARGRRHREGAQEEVIVVLEGRITLALGEPSELVEVPAGGLARIGVGTEIQVRNEGEDDALLLIWGAPPITGHAEILDDLT